MTLVVYRPAFLRQLNPADPLGNLSCTAYSAAMALDRATLGGIQVSGEAVRERTGLTPAQIAAQGGMTLRNIEHALASWSVYLHDQTGSPWASVLAALNGYQGVILQGHYPALTAGGYGSQPTYQGNHAIYVNNIDGGGTRGLMYDPLASVCRWVPLSVLRAYAEGLHKPGLYFASTRRTPLIAQ